MHISRPCLPMTIGSKGFDQLVHFHGFDYHSERCVQLEKVDSWDCDGNPGLHPPMSPTPTSMASRLELRPKSGVGPFPAARFCAALSLLSNSRSTAETTLRSSASSASPPPAAGARSRMDLASMNLASSQASFCSQQSAPTKRMSDSLDGNTWTTLALRLSSASRPRCRRRRRPWTAST